MRKSRWCTYRNGNLPFRSSAKSINEAPSPSPLPRGRDFRRRQNRSAMTTHRRTGKLATMFLRRAPVVGYATRRPFAKPSPLRLVFLSFYFVSSLTLVLIRSLARSHPTMQLSRIADSCATERAVLPLLVKLSIFARDNHHLPPD